MKSLEINQRLLTWLCAFNNDKPVNVWQRCAFIMFSLLVLIGNVSVTISSAIFFWTYLSTDLEQSLCAMYQLSGNIAVSYVLMVQILQRHKTTATIKRLTEIYDEHKSEDCFRYLEQANNKSEWLCRVYFKYVVIGFAVSTAATSIVSVVVCFLIKGHFESHSVHRPFKLILPWNQSSPLGYFSEICYSIYFGDAHFISNGAFTLLFMSLCLHHQAFSSMYSHTLNKLDRLENDLKNKEILTKLIKFHVSVKDWFLESTEIYSPVILVVLICYTGCSACTVFQFDLILKHIDFRISITIIAVLTGISTLFLYCFFGKLATDSFLEMSDSLYNANWYEHPVALQKHFILMIANTQKPIYYHGFNMAILNLKTFLKLIKAVYTYYMLFKTLTN